MDYKVEDRTFHPSYRELKEHYHTFSGMSDEEFLSKLPSAAHLACIISWVKELSLDMTLGDLGVVHQLIHLMDNSVGRYELKEIRERFDTYLKLV